MERHTSEYFKLGTQVFSIVQNVTYPTVTIRGELFLLMPPLCKEQLPHRTLSLIYSTLKCA